MAEEAKLKHLEMIQAVIERMAANSFHLKGWSVVLVSALFALAAAESNAAFVLLAYIPVIMFWGLDGYFLYEEQKFRDLYDDVRKRDIEEIDFSMNTADVPGSSRTWRAATFSKTLLPFHGAIILAVIVVMGLTFQF